MSGASGPLPLELAEDIAGLMVMTGRAVPAGRWVESLRIKARAARAVNLPHNAI